MARMRKAASAKRQAASGRRLALCAFHLAPCAWRLPLGMNSFSDNRDWQRAWFCIRTQPKHEHIAAGHLKKEPDIEVYLPRIRFKRPSRRGPVWVTEALFPNYLFARFDLAVWLRKVHHAQGVRGVLHFGDRWPAIPAGGIEDLRATVGADQVHVIMAELHPGETVVISVGAFDGLEGGVTRLVPGRERVAGLTA